MNTAIAVGSDQPFAAGARNGAAVVATAALAVAGLVLLFAAVRLVCRHHHCTSRRHTGESGV